MPGLLALMQPYHDATVAYINTPIGTATAAFPGGFPARIADGPMADLINQVQTDAAAEAGFPVEASLAALFTNDAKLNAGPIKLKDAYAVYIYDNTLYVIEATGQMIKDELEWTASYFNQYYYEPAGVTVNSAVRDYNYDLWSGIEYKLDVTKPVGQRVVELKLNGQPLAMDQVVRVALNNYRATGKFPTATKLYQSTIEVRELITNWIMARGTISPSDVFVQNFTLLPPVNIWQSPTLPTVTRTDNADLLWTAFDQTPDDYLKIPSDKKTPAARPQPRGRVLPARQHSHGGPARRRHGHERAQSLHGQGNLSSWAKDATAYLDPDRHLHARRQQDPAQAAGDQRRGPGLGARGPLPALSPSSPPMTSTGSSRPGRLVSSKLVGGAAYNMTYINNYKALNPLGTLLLDAGDIMQGTPISNLLWGESVIDVYNHMGYQAADGRQPRVRLGPGHAAGAHGPGRLPHPAGECLQ